jgi:hypothetical protein
MFKDFTINGFRCFDEVRLEGLERVNIIAGPNNSGKTAALEAIHLHNNPTDCLLPLALNEARGIREPGQSLEEALGWLFHNRQLGPGLWVASRDVQDVVRTLRVWLVDAVTARERFPQAEELLRTSYRPEFVDGNRARLILQSDQAKEPPRFSIGTPSPGPPGLAWASARASWRIPSVFLHEALPPHERDVTFFGELETAKRVDEILPALRAVEPRLQKLSLVPLDGQLVLHGDIGLPRLMPVAFMGEGLRRFLSILLAISNAKGGVVLIDEIENGLHYSVLQSVWQAILEAAQRADAQVFATTHSWECIYRAHELFKQRESPDFRVLRINRLDARTWVSSFDWRAIESMIAMSLEVR